eukprot:TRINITY_DN20803_c0_g1_i2.p1 TRINITY_DN20803_c0_g1~~TRINITY_DN20803_c0_g1_i2.p1  ORF type:complete len:298 (+),score=44.27 TRINITY_DN20803_c0_g1_i2:55-948(+)
MATSAMSVVADRYTGLSVSVAVRTQAPTRVAATHLAGSFCASLMCFPLWKAAAIAQSGYALDGRTFITRSVEALRPPWRGFLNVVLGMTFARSSVLFGAEEGRRVLRDKGYNQIVAGMAPTAAILSGVQVVNQPLTRASIMLQDSANIMARRAQSSLFPSIFLCRHLLETRGVPGLFHGYSVTLFKAVPKYIIAVNVKDVMSHWLAPVSPDDKRGVMIQSAKKSVVAGVTGAILTNPDVARNEMFKTDSALGATLRRLFREHGYRWLWRGADKNIVAVAVPVAASIFLTDIFATFVN